MPASIRHHCSLRRTIVRRICFPPLPGYSTHSNGLLLDNKVIPARCAWAGAFCWTIRSFRQGVLGPGPSAASSGDGFRSWSFETAYFHGHQPRRPHPEQQCRQRASSRLERSWSRAWRSSLRRRERDPCATPAHSQPGHGGGGESPGSCGSPQYHNHTARSTNGD